MDIDIRLRWLGAAGLELTIGGLILAIDPFFTRPSLRQVALGRLRPKTELTTAILPRCDHIFITHAHYDHLMDVPSLANATGAIVHGSTNVCRLMAMHGVPAAQVQEIESGDRLDLGNAQIHVLQDEHRAIFGLQVAFGPVETNLTPPLRFSDFRMDGCHSFLIRVGEFSLFLSSGLSSESPSLVDLLCLAPFGNRQDFEMLLRRMRPKLVLPIHWDDFFRPLSEPLRMSHDPSDWLWPPLRKVDLKAFEGMLSEIVPESKILIPQILETYDVMALLNA